jgi:hypothetical protein
MPSRSYTEEEIQDLTDRVFLLKEQLEAGKMQFAKEGLHKSRSHELGDNLNA